MTTASPHALSPSVSGDSSSFALLYESDATQRVLAAEDDGRGVVTLWTRDSDGQVHFEDRQGGCYWLLVDDPRLLDDLTSTPSVTQFESGDLRIRADFGAEGEFETAVTVIVGRFCELRRGTM
jgi:hypothetical protein